MSRTARTPFAAKENVLLPETYNVVKQASAPAPGMAKRKDLHVWTPLSTAKMRFAGKACVLCNGTEPLQRPGTMSWHAASCFAQRFWYAR